MNNLPAPSPFLPDTNIQFAWDSTSLNYLKTCPRLYQYTMIDGWTSEEESVHLRFGIEYARALQDFHIERTAGVQHDDAVRDVVRDLLKRTLPWPFDNENMKDSAKVKSRENLVRTVIWYLEHFKDDPAKTYIMENGSPAVELSFQFQLDFGPQSAEDSPQPYVLCGHLDRVVEFQGDLYDMDQKTTASTPGSYYFDQYHPDNQMSLYAFASRVIFETPIRGVIIDVAQIAVGFSRFVRGFTYRTEAEIDEWLFDLEHFLAQAESYAANNYWPMNDTACNKYGGCRFRDVCSKSPSVRDRFLESDFKRGVRWNPLKTR